MNQKNINDTIYFNEDVMKMRLKLSKIFQFMTHLRIMKLQRYKFWVDYNLE